MDFIKELKRSYFIGAILYVLLGIVLLCFPQTTLRTICYAISAILVIVGIGYLISYVRNDTIKSYQRNDFVVGLSVIVIALFIAIKSDLIISLLPIFLGMAIIISSIVKLQHSIDLMRVKYAGWWGVLLIAFSSAALGLVLVVHPFAAATTMVRVIGLSTIWNGLTDIATGILFVQKIKEAKQVLGAIDAEAKELD